MSLVADRPIAEQPLAQQPAEMFDEFQYRPMPVLVPISVGLVFASLTAFFWEPLVLVAVVAMGISYWAIRVIHAEPNAWSGTGVAVGAMICQAVIGATAGTVHTVGYLTEVPEGFRRVSFSQEISAAGLEQKDGITSPPPQVKELDGKPVFLKGYMYPTREQYGLTSFVLCKDMGECCFGGQPAPTDMIVVQIKNPDGVNFRTGLVSVAGTFKTAAELDPAGLNPIYQLDADYFSPARTSY